MMRGDAHQPRQPGSDLIEPGSDNQSSETTAPALGLGARLWKNCLAFFTGDGTSNLWPRWLFLRAVGLVYVLVFAGIAVEGEAIVGPGGLAPATAVFRNLSSVSAFEAFVRVPSLLWINASAGAITALTWLGLGAALALVLNLWPRLALSVCWLVFLSFVAAWGEYTPAQLDSLMLEVALLCIPYAPAGLRPGLGASSPPRPIMMFMMRWMLFRIMFGSGVVKIASNDPHWRDLTAMDVMYETSPSATAIGYWVHQLPHAYHLFEVAVTFAAEIVAPLAAVLCGAWGRWRALVVWTVFQLGILLSCNFGWLNWAALAFGVLLLDDRMIAAAASRWRRWPGLGAVLATPASAAPAFTGGPLARYGLRAACGVHFAITVYYFVLNAGVPESVVPEGFAATMKQIASFRSANGYYLYVNSHPAHYMVEFEGSNDRGKTWRSYRYRHLAQAVDEAPDFTAPWFPRYENTVFMESGRAGKISVIPATAQKLLQRNPNVMALFDGDPFKDRPPNVIRMRRYKFTMTDVSTLRRTGHYWKKEFAGDYLPAICLLENGQTAQFDLADAETELKAGNHRLARAIFEAQFQLGNLDAGYRLAEVYAQGLGGPPEPARAFALLSDLATRGETTASYNLGLCYEFGVGTAIDPAKAVEAYRRAADDGSLPAMVAVGSLAARDLLTPRNDVEGLSWLLTAAKRATGDGPVASRVREQQAEPAKRLKARLSAADVARAEALAASRD
jgi:TPR repeat protein